MKLALNGNWKVSYVEYNEIISEILEEEFVPEGWLNADVPEEIHSTLRKAGVIRGNVYTKNEDEELWIEEKDWIYYKELFVPASLKAEKVILEFQGLDTFCDIYLNGIKIGFNQNMHTSFKANIGDVLKFNSRNVLVVRFYSAVNYVKSMDEKGIFSITTSDRILARKAQMNYSWDFCGRCVTTGIWKNACIHSWNDTKIDSYYLYTKNIEGNSAIIGLEVEPEIIGESPLESYSLSVSFQKNGQEVYSKEGSFVDFKSVEISIENPALWWPRPYGIAELYDFVLTLKKDGAVIQEKRQKFGIRTVEIIQEKQADGKSFIFAVNGRKLFVRGANWVPVNTVYTDITDEDYEDLIDYAATGNISMLRIWGGGIYESPRMFELCDEKGIMVWSDFMFSCGIYPQNDEFLANVSQEAEFVIKEYRNYTSLVIWAGDNENGQAYGWAGRPYEFIDDKISNVVLKNACERFDPNRFYLPTSPCSPDEEYKGGDNPQSPYQGDLHLYIMSADPGVCSNRDYGKNYYKKVQSFKPRFMSEFGFICLPEKDTFYKFNFLKEPIRYRKELVEFLPFTNEYIDKKEHNKTIYFSQVYNSMALKYWIEYFRSLKWTCSGSLYWKFNDPIADCPKGGIFPSHMSTVDMYRKPKMTYYYTRRAYDDLAVVCIETDTGYNVFCCNEMLDDFSGRLTVKHMNFAGDILAQKEFDCNALKDSSTLLCRLATEDFDVQDAYSEYIKVEFVTEAVILENRYFFADICEIYKLNLKESNLNILNAEINGSQITLKIKTEYYARNVRLNILDKRADYSDNYFEMDANSEKTITVLLHNIKDIENTVLYIEGENTKRMILPLCSITEE